MAVSRIRSKTVLIYVVSISLVLQCLSFAGLSYGSTCPRQISKVESGRKCRKSCRIDSNCRGKRKSCLCDGVCGMSCYNPNSYCPILRSPQNGFVSITGRTVGKSAKHHCKDGYTLLGSKVRTCRSDKKWSGNDSKCEDFSKCGVGGNLNIQRVVGGSDAMKDSWPWQVVLLRKNKILRKSDIFAGGSIIHNNWILTAAHIFLEFPGRLEDIDWKTNFTMIAGITEFPEENGKLPDGALFIEPSQVIVHEEFNPRTNKFDIALVKVGKTSKDIPTKKSNSPIGGFHPITFSRRIRPICLPCDTATNEKIDEKSFNNCLKIRKNQSSDAVVTGFGTTNVKTIEYPKYLQEGKLTIMPQSRCNDVLRTLNSPTASKIPSGLVCARGRRPGTDACYGDSGGPLVQQVKMNELEVRWVQTGIVSFGFDCGGNYPGYYTATSHFLTWITKHVQTEKPEEQLIPSRTECDGMGPLRLARAAPWRVTILTKTSEGKLNENSYAPAAYGIILNQRWILTVAHLFTSKPTCSGCTILRFGESQNLKLYWISTIAFHPKFNRQTLRYNVVMMKVASSFRLNSKGWIYDYSTPYGIILFNKYIQPICENCLKTNSTMLDKYESCSTQELPPPALNSIRNRPADDVFKKRLSAVKAFSLFKCGNISKSIFCTRGPSCDVMPGQTIIIERPARTKSKIAAVGMVGKKLRCMENMTGIYTFTSFHEVRQSLA